MYNQTNQCFYYLPLSYIQQAQTFPQSFYSINSLEVLLAEIQKMELEKNSLIYEINEECQ